MKPALIVLSFVVAFSSCELLRSNRKPESKNPSIQLRWSIDQFNAGHTDAARESLESVIEATPGPDHADTVAAAHFYLAAVFWDLGESRKSSRHMRRCISLQPNYLPDWKYFAPSLRKRYEHFK